MKLLTILIISTLLTFPVFSQNKIVKQYNKKNYDKCLQLCDKHIKKRTKLKQTANLYKSLLYAGVYAKYVESTTYLLRVWRSKNFEEFYIENKETFYQIQNHMLAAADSSHSVIRFLPMLDKLSGFYLYRFRFSESQGSANFKNQSSQTSYKAEYLKYRLFLEYTQKLNADYTIGRSKKTKEILLLSSILLIAKTIDDFKVVYNEIHAYLQNNNKIADILDNLAVKYSKKADFEYKPIGNPKILKETINYQKVKERVKNCKAENEKTIEELSKYLTSDFSEAEKVYAIYHWVDTNLTYKKDSTSKVGVNTVYQQSEYGNEMVRTSQSAKVVLKNKFAVCEGYASLFTALCYQSGISCVDVSGYSASTSNIVGYHGWNIVKIKEKWYLIDVTWGGEKYFLADNLMFNERHYAAKNNQLIFAPYSKAYFFKNAQKYAENNNANKTDSLSMFKLAYVYYESGEYNKAIKAFKSFGNIYELTFDYHYYLGLSYSSISDKGNAIIQMKKALEIKANNIEMLIQLSKLYRLQYNFNEAYKYLNKAKKIRPKKNSIHRSEIYLLHKMKEYDKALKIADSLVTNQAKDIENLIVRAYLYTNNNKFKKGISDCETILKRDNVNTDALGYLAECWQGLEDYEKSLVYISKLHEINANDYNLLFKKAFLLSLMKKYQEAYDLALKMKAIRPLSQDSWGNLAWYSILTKRYDEAIAYAETSIAINKITEVWNSLALAYIYTNQYAKAEYIYMEYKDKKYPISAGYETYGEFFIKWINYLSDNNMHHADFEKAKKLLIYKQ